MSSFGLSKRAFIANASSTGKRSPVGRRVELCAPSSGFAAGNAMSRVPRLRQIAEPAVRAALAQLERHSKLDRGAAAIRGSRLRTCRDRSLARRRIRRCGSRPSGTRRRSIATPGVAAVEPEARAIEVVAVENVEVEIDPLRVEAVRVAEDLLAAARRSWSCATARARSTAHRRREQRYVKRARAVIRSIVLQPSATACPNQSR